MTREIESLQERLTEIASQTGGEVFGQQVSAPSDEAKNSDARKQAVEILGITAMDGQIDTMSTQAMLRLAYELLVKAEDRQCRQNDDEMVPSTDHFARIEAAKQAAYHAWAKMV